MKEFKGNEAIGEVVASLPKAAEIFKEYKIDFCCGGNRILSSVAAEQNIPLEKLLEELMAAQQLETMVTEEKDFNTMGYGQLIDYIVSTHHAYLVRELPKLRDLIGKILRVHGQQHPELSRIHKLFHNLETELEQHMIKEEEILFPLAKAYEAKPAQRLLMEIYRVNAELEEEHEGAGDILKALRALTNNYMPPADGCGSYVLTYKGLEALEWDLFQHIHLENNILFPRLAEESLI